MAGRNLEKLRAWRKANPEKQHAWNIKRTYGMSAVEYTALSKKQNHRCAICKRTHKQSKSIGKKLHVDHDHVTGIVRGLLCQHCNRGLGGFKDKLSRVAAAVKYLEDHGALILD